MKKIFFLLLLLPFLASAQKTTPGNYTYIAQRYEWIAGMFQALGLPSGSGPAAFTIGQVPRAGAVYYDSLGVDAGFYIYNGTAWVLQGTSSAVELPNELLAGGKIVYSGTGLKFYITPSIARINGIVYGTDLDSVTLSASDPDDPRKDVIYLATTGVEVLTGTPAGPAAEPQLDADQIKLTVVDVPALATTPGITQQVLYDENTESTVTGTGVTVNPASTTDVYRLTVALDVGTLSNADVITIDAALPTLAWDLTGVNSLDGFIRLKAVMPAGGRLRIQLFNGSTAIGAEVDLVINKSFLDWQPFSIPISAMGNLTSLSFTRVRIRYNTTVGNYAGVTLDYTYLQDGIVQPGPGGAVNSVTLQGPAGWTFNGPTTGDVIQTIIPGGTSTQMLGGDGVVKTDSAVKYIGTINSLTKSANGATINTLTNEIVLQEADADDNGLLSEYDWRRFDTTANQTVEPGGGGDSLIYAIDAFRTGIKDLVAGSNITITPTDTTLVIAATGGGGSGLFPTTGTGTATGAVVGSLDGNTLTVNHGGNEFFHIDPTAGDEHAHLQAYNGTDLDNISTFTANTNNTSAIALFSASFNGSNKSADISALANATKSTLVYSADTNTVNGSVVISDLAGNGSGVVGVDNDGLLSWSAGSGGSTETASEGLTKAGNDIQLGQTIGAVGNPALITASRQIPLATSSFLAIRDTSVNEREFRFDGTGKFHIYSPGSPSIRLFTNPQGAEQVFPSLSFWRNDSATTAGATLFADFGVDRGPSTQHVYLDLRNEVNMFKIEKNGVAMTQFQDNGDAMIGGFGTKRTRFGSYVTPTRTVDITGSYAVSDSALFPNRLQITDTTGFDVPMLDRSTGLMKRIRADQLGVGGGSQTLQQVLDAGSTLTSNEVITLGGNSLSFTGNNSAQSLGISVTSGPGFGLSISTPSNAGVYSTNSGGFYAAYLNTTHSSTNSIRDVLMLEGSSTGTVASGFGRAIRYELETASGGGTTSNKIISKWSDPAVGTYTSEVDIEGYYNATPVMFMNIQKDLVRINNNADTLATKAYARSVGGGGGSGTFIGLTDVPASYSGNALKVLRANAGETALEFVTLAGGGDALTTDPLSQFAATTSAQLAGVLSDEQGSAGGFVRATSPTITTPTVSGTITSSAVSVTITNASGEGNALTEMTARVNSDVTLANSAVDQTLFGTTNDVWTLQGNTTYKFKGIYRLTSGSTSHTWAMGFDLGGGASITSMLYSTGSWNTAVNNTSTARTNTYIDQVATTVCTAASTTASFIEFEGVIVMNAGGTVTPLIKASVDPTGTILLKENSYISFTPIGNGTFEKIGNVN